MASKDLITRARAYQNLQGVSGVDALIDTLITAASDAIEKWCARSFFSRTLDECYGAGGEILLLREYPVQSITWIRACPQVVLEICNSATATNQRATVQVTSTGLTLTRVASGVVSSNTGVTWASYVTLADVESAVSALGNGWSARVAEDFDLWPSADLYQPPVFGDGLHGGGAWNARGTWAGLRLHVRDLDDFTWDPRGFVYLDSGVMSASLQGSYRVKYTAGYTTIPEAVQQACADWVAQQYYRTLHDPALRAESSAPTGGTATFKTYLDPIAPPLSVAQLLAPFRRRMV